VDSDYVFFSPTRSIGQDSALPVILGLETKVFGPKPGRRYRVKELELAMRIIDGFKERRRLRNFRLKSIKAASPEKTVLVLAGGIQVKIADQEIEKRLDILGDCLASLKNEIENIRYIDLRFSEPVIKLKNAK
ncbi:cell division protein FtsQ/DivIB, partial [Candidatus Omnitrophota bacterium]